MRDNVEHRGMVCDIKDNVEHRGMVWYTAVIDSYIKGHCV